MKRITKAGIAALALAGSFGGSMNYYNDISGLYVKIEQHPAYAHETLLNACTTILEHTIAHLSEPTPNKIHYARIGLQGILPELGDHAQLHTVLPRLGTYAYLHETRDHNTIEQKIQYVLHELPEPIALNDADGFASQKAVLDELKEVRDIMTFEKNKYSAQLSELQMHKKNSTWGLLGFLTLSRLSSIAGAYQLRRSYKEQTQPAAVQDNPLQIPAAQQPPATQTPAASSVPAPEPAKTALQPAGDLSPQLELFAENTFSAKPKVPVSKRVQKLELD